MTALPPIAPWEAIFHGSAQSHHDEAVASLGRGVFASAERSAQQALDTLGRLLGPSSEVLLGNPASKGGDAPDPVELAAVPCQGSTT